MIRIDIDDRDLKKMVKRVEKLTDNAPKHIASSMNKALEEAKPKAATAVESRYNIGGVESKLVVRRATAGGLSGSIEGRGGMLTVDQFGAQEEEGGVVSVEIIRGRRRAILPSSRGQGVSGAFMVNGSRVMQRKQAERYPIYPVWTIGIPQMLGSKAVSEPIRDMIGKITMDRISEVIMKL